jgi:hypothetical protein
MIAEQMNGVEPSIQIGRRFHFFSKRLRNGHNFFDSSPGVNCTSRSQFTERFQGKCLSCLLNLLSNVLVQTVTAL